MIGFFSTTKFKNNNTSKDIYEPKYEVVQKFNSFEIRKYDEMYVASSTIPSNSYEESSGNGFRRVAGYIFGGNQKNQKIAMTSPVLMDMNETVTMSFVMPPEVTSINAPKPNDNRVVLGERPSEILAVIRFGGWANDAKLKAKKEELLKLLEKENIEYYGNTIYMGYNPPYQLINRKNELAIRVRI
jgi:hypothetical protein